MVLTNCSPLGLLKDYLMPGQFKVSATSLIFAGPRMELLWGTFPTLIFNICRAKDGVIVRDSPNTKLERVHRGGNTSSRLTISNVDKDRWGYYSLHLHSRKYNQSLKNWRFFLKGEWSFFISECLFPFLAFWEKNR